MLNKEEEVNLHQKKIVTNGFKKNLSNTIL